MNAPEPIPFKSEGPEPLVREIPAGQAYPIEALGALRDATEAAQDKSQAPIALAAQSALSIASLAVQSFADVETLGGPAPLSLFCLTVADSGERKSATDKLLMKGWRDYEQEQTAQYSDELKQWKNSSAIWEADHKLAMKPFNTGKGDRDAALADLAALGERPAPPIAPNLAATEPTLEGLHKLYMVGQPSLGLFSDEGGQFLGGHSMNSENRLKTIAGLSDLWGGSAINRTRSGDGTVTLYGRRLAAHLMIQPIVATPFLSDPVASGQGFLARFLITHPPSAIGSRQYREAKPESEIALSAFAETLKAVLSAPKLTADGDPRHLKPRHLPLSQGAKNLLKAFYNSIEAEQGRGGDLADVTAFASKAAEQAARIAGVLTLWDKLDAQEVATEAMADGIKLSQFYLAEAKRLSDAATISEATEKAEKLRRWLLDSWPDIAAKAGHSVNHITPRDVMQRIPTRALRESKEAKAALTFLENHGWVQRLSKGTIVNGAPRSEAFLIVRPET